jgi:hypothetical protein
MTSAAGEDRFAALPPGDYEVTYTLSGMATAKRNIPVYLQHNAEVDVALAVANFEGEIEVTGANVAIDTSSAEIKAAIPDQVIEKLPVGQQYRDLVKLVPGVQYSEDTVREPSRPSRPPMTSSRWRWSRAGPRRSASTALAAC